MKLFILLSILLCSVDVYSCEKCPNETAFLHHGWVIHSQQHFEEILEEKLSEFMVQYGNDLVLDDAESYVSDFSHDCDMIMWIIILDRVSTTKDEMWGDIAFSKTGPNAEEFTEVRWYDPVTKTKHIVCNSDYAFCLTTNVPLAYNTIF